MAFVTSIICSIKGIPLVYDIHDSSKEVISAAEFSPLLTKVYIKAALFFEKEIIKRTTGIVTVSESLKALLLNTRGIFKECSPYFIVMRNIDSSLRSITEENRDGGQDYIFYSGTLYSKFIGIEFLIDSTENLLRSGKTRLYIAGDGPYKKILERYIISKDLSASVKLLGYVQKDRIGSYIEGSKITVIPYERNSLTEIALPNKLFEYMSFGKPVVYPDLPGFREVLGNGNEGKYKPGDKDDLERVIENMLTNESLRKSVGDKNKILLKEITFEKEFSKLVDLYNKILI
jgi:glycosyltransferase involved in cell wall biosynthesis